MAVSSSSNPPPRGSSIDPPHPDARQKTELRAGAERDVTDEVVERSTSNVYPFPSRPGAPRASVEFAGDRAELVAALARGEEGAAVAIFHEYGSLVERTLARILGADAELPDAMQEVFWRALRSVHTLRDPQALTEWLLRITVFTATDCLRRRSRRRWLVLLDPTVVEGPPSAAPDESGREALRATYRVLDRLGVEDRMVFALRFIDGMELVQLASACGCSLATVKRRVQRARTRFVAVARREPALAPWLGASPADDEEDGA